MKTLEFGIIGLGHFGKHYVRLLATVPDAHLKTVADNQAEAELLLSDPKIDCVIIVTSLTSHFELASAALNFGKHVLVEKPLATNLKEAELLQDVVKKNSRVLMVGYQYLYNDYIKGLKENLDKQILGKINYFFSEHLYFGPLRKDAGVFWDAAPHELSILDYLFGPLAIVDVCGKALNFSESWYDDFVAGEVKFRKNFIFTFVLSRFAPQKVRRMTIGGEKGMAVFDDLEAQDKLKLFLHSYPSREEIGSKSSLFMNFSEDNVLIPKIRAQEPLLRELEHFIECVRKSKVPFTDIEHSIRITRQLEKIYRSLI